MYTIGRNGLFGLQVIGVRKTYNELVIIRPAQHTDLDDLGFVAKVSYEEAFGRFFNDKESLEIETKERRSRSYFETVMDRDTIIVAQIDDSVVGYLQFGSPSEDIQDATDTDIEFRRLYILSEFHRKGIGSQLIDAMLAHENLMTARKLYVEVWKQNEAALGLYQKYGFEFTGQQRPFFEQGEIVGYDDLMVKYLNGFPNGSSF